MAILFVDLHALSAANPHVQDMAADWLHAGHAAVYIHDANAPRPAGLPEDPAATWLPTAGPGTAYLEHAFSWCLDHIGAMGRRRRAAFVPTPPVGRFGEVRPCVLLTAPGRLPPQRAKALGLAVLVPSDHAMGAARP
jgi:hypothetical protein